MWLEPNTMDGGTQFEVFSISDSGFSGAWTHGAAGYIGQVMRIGGVELYEYLQGYFCAVRIRRR